MPSPRCSASEFLILDVRNRICPGRFFAQASIFLTLFNILHTFDIELPKDAEGNVVPISVEMTDELVSCVSISSTKFRALIVFASQATKTIRLYHQTTLGSSRSFGQGELCRFG